MSKGYVRVFQYGSNISSRAEYPTSRAFLDVGFANLDRFLRLQRVRLQKFAEFPSRRPKASHDVLAILTNSRSLIVQFVQDKLWRKMVLMDKELVCRLANYTVLFETALGKMFRVLRDNRVSVSHNSSG